ncbi:unnamed protein product [Ixodes persulcatus]
MSSLGASITALAGRGSSVSSANSDYRIVLPPLPSGAIVCNFVLLHGDVARPYKIGDFRAEMERLGVIGHIEGLGAYQMNHLWIVTFNTEEAKLRLVTAKELEVKGKRCIVVDPENADVRMKLHWLPFHASDETVRRALEPFGKVQDLTREKWKAEGFTGVQSTTRLVRLNLKKGVTLERLPHQLRMTGGSVLVVIPGRSNMSTLQRYGTHSTRGSCTAMRRMPPLWTRARQLRPYLRYSDAGSGGGGRWCPQHERVRGEGGRTGRRN